MLGSQSTQIHQMLSENNTLGVTEKYGAIYNTLKKNFGKIYNTNFEFSKFYKIGQTASENLSFEEIMNYWHEKSKEPTTFPTFYFSEIPLTKLTPEKFRVDEGAKTLLQKKVFGPLFGHLDAEIKKIINEENLEVIIKSERDIEIPTWETIAIVFIIDRMQSKKRYELWAYLEDKIRGKIKQLENNCPYEIEKEKIREFNKTIAIALKTR